ncbi:thiamine pyrophosphate-dependent enzyme [Candidatus Deianiraea vastatrix]|uniref:Transketolase (N-terminal) n=1 Tax=Candidatus Deianiraea vastatrix TaxID=2163644 RepID=A0A5B8XGA4_9RICK|nr:hypothetical protein [Candidatus Deianiraea vastatrix]QED23885.1 Putative transketolase (N-terminal) [Candidatus Deianiraea vastatrix]
MNKTEIRRLILDKAYNSNTGHIGSSLSICDIIWCLYDRIMKVGPSDFEDVKNPERDVIFL